MNISRDAFYSLVRMQNSLNDMRNQKSGLIDDIQAHLDLPMDDLQSEIQALTTKYLDEVDYNRRISNGDNLVEDVIDETEDKSYWGILLR